MIKVSTGTLMKQKARIAHLRSRICVQKHPEEAGLNLEHREKESPLILENEKPYTQKPIARRYYYISTIKS